jgi:hypothetical protein
VTRGNPLSHFLEHGLADLDVATNAADVNAALDRLSRIGEIRANCGKEPGTAGWAGSLIRRDLDNLACINRTHCLATDISSDQRDQVSQSPPLNSFSSFFISNLRKRLTRMPSDALKFESRDHLVAMYQSVKIDNFANKRNSRNI